MIESGDSLDSQMDKASDSSYVPVNIGAISLVLIATYQLILAWSCLLAICIFRIRTVKRSRGSAN